METIWSPRRRGRELSVSLRVIFVTRCGRGGMHVEVPHWNGCGRRCHGRFGSAAERGRGGLAPARWWPRRCRALRDGQHAVGRRSPPRTHGSTPQPRPNRCLKTARSPLRRRVRSTRVRVRSSLASRRWPAGRAAELRKAGGSTPTVHTAGSVRCSGRSPIAIFMTTRFSVTVAASGPMATAISTPRSSRLTLPAISQRSRPSAMPGGGIAKRPPCRSSAALTPPR